MRARNIKPAFFKNYDLADCGPVCQILFAGLWCLADKEGRLENKPRLIKAELFPYYDVDINRELTVLERLKFIRTYSVDGIDVIEVPNFKKHQNPHHTEKNSILPEFQKTNNVSDCFAKELDINRELTVDSRLTNGEYLADSLIPDSLIPDAHIGPPEKKQPTKPKIPNCQYQAVIEIYNETLPELPRAVALNTKREKLIKARWNWLFTTKKQNKEPRALNAEQALDWFREFFLCAKEDDFLMGRTQRRSGYETWTCSIDYLLEDRCLTKILEKTQG